MNLGLDQLGWSRDEGKLPQRCESNGSQWDARKEGLAQSLSDQLVKNFASWSFELWLYKQTVSELQAEWG